MSKQNIGIEEIQKIMQENNLSFSDIAKIAAGMNNGIITEKEKSVVKEIEQIRRYYWEGKEV